MCGMMNAVCVCVFGNKEEIFFYLIHKKENKFNFKIR